MNPTVVLAPNGELHVAFPVTYPGGLDVCVTVSINPTRHVAAVVVTADHHELAATA